MGLLKKLDDLITFQDSTYPLAVFRVIFVSVFLLETIQNFYFRSLFFDQIPFFPNTAPVVTAIFAVWMICLIALLLGYKIMFFGTLNYLLAAIILGYGGKRFGYDWHADGLYILGSLFLLIMPTTGYLSVEQNSTEQTKASYFYPFLFILTIGTIYIDSMFWKATSPMYLSGLGFWAPASLPYNTYFDLSPILEFEWFNRVVGYGVLFFETTFFLLIWSRRWRPIVIALGIFFHISILIAFPIPNFSFAMIAFFMGILPIEIYRKFNLVPSSFEARSQIQESKQPNRTFAYLLTAFWVVSFGIITFKSPFYRTFFFPNSNALTLVEKAAGRYKNLVYPLTGFSDHGVFMDSHFLAYDSQLYLESEGDPLPMISEFGTAGWYNVNRNWVVWTFRGADPSYAPEKSDEVVTDFVEFWIEAGSETSVSEIQILSREIKPSLNQWQPNLLDENRERLWQEVGVVILNEEKVDIIWTNER